MKKKVVTIESTPCGGKGLHIDGRAFCPCPAPLAETWRIRMQKELDDAFDAGAEAERGRCLKRLKDLSMGMMASSREAAALVVMDCCSAIRGGE